MWGPAASWDTSWFCLLATGGGEFARKIVEKGACGHRQVSGDHSGGMGHNTEDTQDRDRRREITGVVCCANHPPKPIQGPGHSKQKGCQGWEPLSGACLSVSRIIGTQRPDCLLYVNTKAFGGVSVIC